MKNIFLFLIAFLAREASALCGESDIDRLTNDFYRYVAPGVGVPKPEEKAYIGKILSDAYVRDINNVKQLEERASQLAFSSGEDAWPSMEYFFVGNSEGFHTFKVITKEKNRVRIELKGTDFEGNRISWVDTLSFVNANGHCHVDDVVFDNGQSSRKRLDLQAEQYLKAIRIYLDKSTGV